MKFDDGSTDFQRRRQRRTTSARRVGEIRRCRGLHLTQFTESHCAKTKHFSVRIQTYVLPRIAICDKLIAVLLYSYRINHLLITSNLRSFFFARARFPTTASECKSAIYSFTAHYENNLVSNDNIGAFYRYSNNKFCTKSSIGPLIVDIDHMTDVL
jgi:hypothetical protein